MADEKYPSGALGAPDMALPQDKPENIPQHELNRRWAEQQQKEKYFAEQKEKERLSLEQQQLDIYLREKAAEQRIQDFVSNKKKSEEKIGGSWIGPDVGLENLNKTNPPFIREKIAENMPLPGADRHERNFIGDMTPEERAKFKKDYPMPR